MKRALLVSWMVASLGAAVAGCYDSGEEGASNAGSAGAGTGGSSSISGGTGGGTAGNSAGTGETAGADSTGDAGENTGGSAAAGAGGDPAGAINGGASSAGDAGEAGAPESGGMSGSPGSGDVPYAHVVAVAPKGEEMAYRFDVSVESADLDCTQFANWWEVLSEDGSLLYRRILEHSHTDENGTSDADAPGNTFTRDGGPIAVSADTIVIVRAHMSNVSGYNGRVMRGSAASGFAEAPEITSDFAADVVDDPPQPTSCAF